VTPFILCAVGAARFAVAWLAAAGLAACGLALNGEETGGDAGPTLHDAGADVTTADASQGSSSGGDTGVPPEASNDTGTMADVVVPETGLVDGCVPKGPESCTNGIDDDCNGLVDCADPACTTQGFRCVTPSPMAGWDFVAFDATSQAGCPATLKAKNVDVDPTNLASPTVCGCTCAVGTPPSCEQGNISTTHSQNNQCGGSVTNYPASGGACIPQDLSVDAFVLAAQPPPAGGTCGATASVTQPATGATQGEVCSGETTFGGGCAGTQVCALVPTGFTSCVHHGGASMACPAPYSTPHSVGTLKDTRGCGNCACGLPTATCSAGTWAFFGSQDCTGSAGVTLDTNDQCNGTGSAQGSTFRSNQFSSIPMPGSIACATPPTPPSTGNVMLTGADTVCCD